MLNKIKINIFNNYIINYTDYPKGTGKIIPLVIIESMAMSVSYLISIYLVNSLHFTPFQIGKLVSSLSLGTCIGSLLSGYLTTRVSVTKVSSLGLFIYALGFFLLSCVTSYHYLLATLFLCGVGGIFMMIANLTALIKLADDDLMKNRIIVLQSVVFNLSISVCSFLMGYLKTEALKDLFVVFGVLLLFSGMFVFSIKRNSSIIKTNKAPNRSGRINLPVIIMILPIIFFYGVIYSLVKIYFPVEAVSRFNNPFFSWLVMSTNPLMIIFLQPLLINKLKSRGNIFLLSLGACFLGFGYVMFGLSTYLIPSILFVFLATVGEMIFSPISKKLAATSFGYGNEGIGLASWKMTYYFSGVLGAVFVGYLGENFQKLNIWLICIPLSIAIILCAICYNSYVENKQKRGLYV